MADLVAVGQQAVLAQLRLPALDVLLLGEGDEADKVLLAARDLREGLDELADLVRVDAAVGRLAAEPGADADAALAAEEEADPPAVFSDPGLVEDRLEAAGVVGGERLERLVERLGPPGEPFGSGRHRL